MPRVSLRPKPSASSGVSSAGMMPIQARFTEPLAMSCSATCLARLIGIAERQARQIVGLDLYHRDVGLGVGADDGRLEGAAIVEGDRDVAGIPHHVVVGEDVPLGIDDETRPRAGLHAIAVRSALTE